MSRFRRAAFRLFAAVLALAALAAAAAWLRARLLPAAEVPVLRYARIAEEADPADPSTVPSDLFYLQMRDLRDAGFETVPPARLRARARWGRPLPPAPFLVVLDEPGPVWESDVAPVLAEFGFEALSPAEAADAGLGFAPDEGVARIGAGTDFSALPCVRVVGGTHAFSAVARQDAVDPAFFGTLRVAHPEGPPLAFSVLVYRPGDDRPFVQADVPESLPPDDSFDLPLPADAAFPLEVVFYETNRVAFYHSVVLPRSSVVRPAGWRVPLAAPGEEVVFDPLPALPETEGEAERAEVPAP